jgi:hypothetical protein
MPPTGHGQESDEQTRAYRKALTERKMNAERKRIRPLGAAGRPQQDGGANANCRVRVGYGRFCFESGGYDYRDGCDDGSYGSGRR